MLRLLNAGPPPEHRFKCMFGEIRSPVFVFSTAAQLLYANEAALHVAARPREIDGGSGRQIDPALAASLGRKTLEALAGRTDALFESELHDFPCLCHAAVLSDEHSAWAGIVVFCHDVTRLHEAADRRVAAEQELMRTLVKEVHHRIKNNLQATVGLLREHSIGCNEAAPALQKGISQLLSIAAVHGIQARVHEDRIYLCSVVDEVVRAARSTTRLPIRSPRVQRTFALEPRHAVPIALIVNELITNAAKYTTPAAGACIAIDIEAEGEGASLVVANSPARLPDDFTLATAQGIGAGLRLVRSLLPYRLATLDISNEGEGVAARLRLIPPAVARSDAPPDERCDAPADEPDASELREPSGG